eukprot:5553386-Prymnesium_polylepis.1
MARREQAAAALDWVSGRRNQGLVASRGCQRRACRQTRDTEHLHCVFGRTIRVTIAMPSDPKMPSHTHSAQSEPFRSIPPVYILYAP